MTKRLPITQIVQELHIIGFHPSKLQGHEDNVGEYILIPIFAALGFDTRNADDLKLKPRISHSVISKYGLEPDYGLLKYGQTKEGSPKYGMVADTKRYGTPLTPEMEEKLAGYCGLTGAIVGVLTNGVDAIVLKPTRGVVEWEYLDRIPSKTELQTSLVTKPDYKGTDITYAKRIVQEITEPLMEEIAEKCHNIIRSRKGLAVPDRLYEFSKLIVARIVDERRYKEKQQPELLITSENVKTMKQKKQTIKSYITNILNTVQADIGIFSKDESINLDDDVVEQIIEYLDDYQLWSDKMDVLGHVYEKFLMNTMTGRELGGYFTPRPIVELVVKMVDPALDKTILDPACGSGGFLISPLMYLMNKHNMRDKESTKRIASKFTGIDIFADIVKLCQINLWLHGDCHDNVFRADSLDLSAETPNFILQALTDSSTYGLSYIFTNPPYGALTGNKLTVDRLEAINKKWKEKGIDLFECSYGSKGVYSLQPQVPFIELCLKLLKTPKEPLTGGKLGIVIDNGILSNTIQEAPIIRSLIKKYAIIEAIVGLPKGSFKAYGSNVIPVIMILRKKHPAETQGAIFRAEVKKIGLIPGRTLYVKDSDLDLNKVFDLWQKWLAEPKQDTLKVLDEKLPVWSLKSDDYRMDNNFVSPSSIIATDLLHKLEQEGKYELKSLDSLVENIESGLAPVDDGDLSMVEGGNIQPNFVFPVFVKRGSIGEGEEGFVLSEGDLLMVKDGTPATFAPISKAVVEAFGQVMFSYHIYRIRLKKEYTPLAFYFSSFLNSKLGQALVRKYISGGVTPTIREDELRKVLVPIPKDALVISDAKEKLEAIQKSVIASIGSLQSSEQLDKLMNPEDALPYLPANWLGAGKGDKQGYWKDFQET